MPTATATKTEPVTFISKCMNQTLTRRPAMNEARAPNGAVLIPADPGERVTFDNHRYEATEGDQIEWLRRHPFFNVTIWEEGAPPDEPKPTLDQQIQAIQEAKDVHELQALIDAEQDTHNRRVVISAARRAMSSLEPKATEEKKPSTSKPSEKASTPSKD